MDLFSIIYTYFFCFMIGAVFASAFTCQADRLLAHESWVSGRSHCDVCGHVLSLMDMIPVFSYLVNRGKCRYCGAKLSSKYLWTEVLSGIVFCLVFWKDGFSAACLCDWAVCLCLLALSLVDLAEMWIPDRYLIASVVIYVLKAAVCHLDWKMGLAGGISIGGFVFVVSLIMDKILKKESMGGGDIKLLFVMGLYLGLLNGLLCLIISCITGLFFVLKLNRKQIPFGPSISIAFVFGLLWGEKLVQLYLSLFV